VHFVTGHGQPGDRLERALAPRAQAPRPGEPPRVGEATGRAGATAPLEPPRAAEPAPPGPRRPGWLARVSPGGMIYGSIVVGAALAVSSGRGDTPWQVDEAMLSTVLIYWLAHIYIATLDHRHRGPGGTGTRIRAAARHEAPILAGGLPAIAVFTVLWLTGVTVSADVIVTLCVTIATLALGGYLVGRQAGAKGWRLAAEAASAAVFGLLIALLLMSLHVH
jgi:hypothetical protein